MDYSATTRPYGCDLGWFFGKCCIMVVLSIAGLLSFFTTIYASYNVYLHTLLGTTTQLGIDGFALALSMLIVIFCITACCIVTAGIDHKYLTVPVLLIMLLLLVLCLVQVAAIANGSMGEEVEKSFEVLLDNYASTDPAIQTAAQNRSRTALDSFQNQRRCCGAFGPSDYTKRSKLVPKSCGNEQIGCVRGLIVQENILAGILGFQEILWLAFGLNILCAYFLFSSKPNQLNTPSVRLNLPTERMLRLTQEPVQQISIQQQPPPPPQLQAQQMSIPQQPQIQIQPNPAQQP